MKMLWLCLCCAWLAMVQGNVYDGFKIFELATMSRSGDTHNLFAELAKNESYYEFYSPNQMMVHPLAQANFIKLLDRHAMTYTVANPDVGLTLRRDFETNLKLRNLLPFTGRLSTERYYSHDEINQFIEQLAKEYPTRVFVKTVGRSYEGRWLKTITITNGDARPNKNVIFMDGGFHAREWISPAAVVYAIGELVENFNSYAALLLDYDWVILPVVNADGYEYSQLSDDTRLWRKTRKPSSADCIGTDPNRNFDFHWNEEGASSNPCAATFAGSKAFSEPEAVVVRDLMHSLAPRGKMYLTIHSHGEYILYPWGWTSDLPNTVDDLHEVAEAGYSAILAATGTNYTIGSSTNVLYIAAGASDDYAFYAGFPISFTMELPAGGPNKFNPPPSDIDKLVKETWVGILAMAQKVAEKYPLE